MKILIQPLTASFKNGGDIQFRFRKKNRRYLFYPDIIPATVPEIKEWIQDQIESNRQIRKGIRNGKITENCCQSFKNFWKEKKPADFDSRCDESILLYRKIINHFSSKNKVYIFEPEPMNKIPEIFINQKTISKFTVEKTILYYLVKKGILNEKDLKRVNFVWEIPTPLT